MLQRIYIIIGISMVSIIVLMLGNHYFIKPKFIPDFSEAATIIKNAQAKYQARRQKYSVTTTLQKMQQGHSSLENWYKGTSQRNPFVWKPLPVQSNDRSPLDIAPVYQAVRTIPELKMVIIGEQRKLAMLDNTFVRERSIYKSNTVQTISAKSVVLVDTFGEFQILLDRAANRQARAQALQQVDRINNANKIHQAELEFSRKPGEQVELVQWREDMAGQIQKVNSMVASIKIMFHEIKPLLQKEKYGN